MKPEAAIRHYGTMAKLARAIKVSRQAVWNWKDRNRIPLPAQLAIHNHSKGALRISGLSSRP
jgi:hypothetical protein